MSKPNPEDAFHENLTLGLIKILSNVPRIANVVCEKRQPCEKSQVMNWEQRHSVYLPEDMKKFYLSTDGFVLHWSYQYAPDDVRRVGCINFSHLLQISLLRENIETFGSSNEFSTHQSNPQTSGPTITPKTKIFELNNICDVAKVCLVYESSSLGNPAIYLLELNSLKWQFLAETFSEYLRMAIAHLGLPYWELCFSSFGLPSWREQLFLLLAPHLLEETDVRLNRNVRPVTEQIYNHLDANIFRAKPKCVKQVPKAK